MSMYNMVCGNNPFYPIYLAMLGMSQAEIPRFRDVWVTDGPAPRIVVFTRTGGGNRPEYAAQNAALAARPGYVRDYDDDLDSTYAHFEFEVPEKYRARVAELQAGLSSRLKFSTPRRKFEAALAALEGKPIVEAEVPEDVADRLSEIAYDLVKDLLLVHLS